MKIKHLRLAVGLFLLILSPHTIWAELGAGIDTIHLSHFGVMPNTGVDATHRLRTAIREISRNRRPAVLLFDPGRYDFYAPAGRDDTTNVVVRLCDIDSLTIDGCGAEFIGHGRLALFQAERCRNLTIRNFSLDWQRPYITQVRIARITGDDVDLAIDKEAYPYCVKNGKVIFMGGTWAREVDPESYSTAYDSLRGGVLYGTRDYPLSIGNALFRGEAHEVADGVVRFKGHPDHLLPIGTPLALYHGRYLTVALLIYRCQNIVFEKIDLYHTPGVGIYGFQSENIRLHQVCTVVNRAKGRYFSGVADAFHFTNCRGLIELSNCQCDGQGDDALNIHGMYARITEISADRRCLTLEAGRSDASVSFEAGDSIWPICAARVTRGQVCQIVKAVNRSVKSCITLSMPLATEIGVGDYVENASWCADAHIHHCHFGRANRARGILLTTPGAIEIDHNKFDTAGAAILIEGDINFWFESGAVCDVNIHDNVFENCGTSASNAGGSGWGEAIISITPSYQPESSTAPAYHHNICIHNNRIYTYDRPLLHARSVEQLDFSENRIEQTYDYPASASQHVSFLLEGCRKVTLRKNEYFGYGNPEITQSQMSIEEVTF